MIQRVMRYPVFQVRSMRTHAVRAVSSHWGLRKEPTIIDRESDFHQAKRLLTRSFGVIDAPFGRSSVEERRRILVTGWGPAKTLTGICIEQQERSDVPRGLKRCG